MEQRVRAVMEEYLELQHGAGLHVRWQASPEAVLTARFSISTTPEAVLTVRSPNAGVDGADLATPTVTCKLDEASGSRMYNLTYRVKGTRAGQLA